MALKPSIPINSLQQPEQGARAIFTPFLFNTRNSQNVFDDLVLESSDGLFLLPQAIWIDNRFNAQPITLQFMGLPMVLQVRAGRQGVYPVICTTGAARWTASSAQTAVDVPAVMFNVALQPWWQDV